MVKYVYAPVLPVRRLTARLCLEPGEFGGLPRLRCSCVGPWPSGRTNASRTSKEARAGLRPSWRKHQRTADLTKIGGCVYYGSGHGIDSRPALSSAFVWGTGVCGLARPTLYTVQPLASAMGEEGV